VAGSCKTGSKRILDEITDCQLLRENFVPWSLITKNKWTWREGVVVNKIKAMEFMFILKFLFHNNLC
jgi:hypothetical protein